jgi:hypothetical protein
MDDADEPGALDDTTGTGCPDGGRTGTVATPRRTGTVATSSRTGTVAAAGRTMAWSGARIRTPAGARCAGGIRAGSATGTSATGTGRIARSG